jgi:glutamate N-acetyltransferase/amino-acid N-acetyltransferase
MNNKEFAVPGFRASSVSAGLKKDTSPDMALILSDREAVAAGVFTTNKIKAAPVLISMERARKGRARAIIANAGNANACTGNEGLNNAAMTSELAAGELGLMPDDILVASTGVIGAQLNMERIGKAIPALVEGLSPEGIPKAAKAIMTTDSFPKISRFTGELGKTPFTILGIAKGAGMIMPDMATMLCFILSDIKIDPSQLKRALSDSVERTFNRITVDGDTSTNDTVIILANGMAGNGSLEGNGYESFVNGLNHVMKELSTMIVRDGEGATKVVGVKVRGAVSEKDASFAARTIANSNLVKTAFYGQDPNWGRIMGALGRSGIVMKEKDVSIWINDIKIVSGGLGTGSDQEKRAAERMQENEFSLIIDLNQGGYEDEVLTCDLTHEYVSINAEYRT